MLSRAMARIRSLSVRDRRLPAPACGLLGAVLLLAAGCAPRPLIERAIRARGGPLTGLVVRTENRVYAGVPGTWECSRAFLAPDRYAWKIVTAADPHFHLFDGTTARSFIGTAEVSSDASPNAPLRTHARWTAVVNLDALHASNVVVMPLAPSDLPTGVREGLLATFADGTGYRLGFDDRTLLVWARGPLDLSPVGTGETTARFQDYRRSGRLLLPFTVSYSLGTTPVADEHVLAACIDPPGLTAASFTDPTQLPDCRP